MPETTWTLRLIRPCLPCFGLGCPACQHTGQIILTRPMAMRSTPAETLIRACPACRGSGERSTYTTAHNCRCRPGPAHTHAPCDICQGVGIGLEDTHGRSPTDR